MPLLTKLGSAVLGSRLRLLSERLLTDASEVFALFGVDLKTKWFPVFHFIVTHPSASVTDVAEGIGLSHPGVIKTLKELKAAGLIQEKKDPNDGRRRLLIISPKGEEVAEKIQRPMRAARAVMDEIILATDHDLIKALDNLEEHLDRRSFLDRMRAQKRLEDWRALQIIVAKAAHFPAFKRLNEAWISRYFTMEKADYQSLDDPQQYLIDPGGSVLVALYEGEVVGTAALQKMDDPDYDFELVKMSVSPRAQGMGIGYQLGLSALDKAREMGAKRVYLETNSILQPAINLYQKLGFRVVKSRPSPYDRCDVQMAITL